MHDVVKGASQQLQLTVWPEDFIISPDPVPAGTTPGPRLVSASDVLIVAALPDPVGADRGNERVTLLNTTASPIDLTGWGLVDAAGGRMDLSGTIAGGTVMQVTVGQAVQLGNQGDALVLVDAAGASIDQMTCKADQVRQVAPSASAGSPPSGMPARHQQ